MLSVEKLEKFAFDWRGASTEMEKQLTECSAKASDLELPIATTTTSHHVKSAKQTSTVARPTHNQGPSITDKNHHPPPFLKRESMGTSVTQSSPFLKLTGMIRAMTGPASGTRTGLSSKTFSSHSSLNQPLNPRV